MNSITRETRQMSFTDIQEKQKVRYEQILDRLDNPKTAKEIAIELYELGITSTADRNTTAPRLTELEKRGIVKVTGKKKCDWTGKQVAVYEKVNYLEDMIAENMQHIPQIWGGKYVWIFWRNDRKNRS